VTGLQSCIRRSAEAGTCSGTLCSRQGWVGWVPSCAAGDTMSKQHCSAVVRVQNRKLNTVVATCLQHAAEAAGPQPAAPRWRCHWSGGSRFRQRRAGSRRCQRISWRRRPGTWRRCAAAADGGAAAAEPAAGGWLRGQGGAGTIHSGGQLSPESNHAVAGCIWPLDALSAATATAAGASQQLLSNELAAAPGGSYVMSCVQMCNVGLCAAGWHCCGGTGGYPSPVCDKPP
jgi:hypothetical protein